MNLYNKIINLEANPVGTLSVGEFIAYKVGHKDACQAAAELTEGLENKLKEHHKVFEWVADNPGCHPENIRSEILRLLKEMKS